MVIDNSAQGAPREGLVPTAIGPAGAGVSLWKCAPGSTRPTNSTGLPRGTAKPFTFLYAFEGGRTLSWPADARPTS